MRAHLTNQQFHQRFQTQLKLSYLGPQIGLERDIGWSSDLQHSYEAVDYLNLIRPSSVVVIGRAEANYLASAESASRTEMCERLFLGPVSTVVVSRKQNVPEWFMQAAEKQKIPVFQSQLGDAGLLENLRYYLNRALAESTNLHGVFLEVSSLGLFITGESGVGKSELALALVSRGHRLIADDITEFTRIGPTRIDGHSPSLLTDFLEVRGLGIINIRAMFGNNALRRNKTLRLIVNLQPLTPENQADFERLGHHSQTRQVLGVPIPEFRLPIAPGRNLAILVEAAARNHLLHMNGYNAAQDLTERQRQAIQANSLEPQ